MKTMQTGKANYRLAARLRGNELLLDADLRKAVEEEGWLGVLTGGLTATAGGIALAITLGLVASFLFRPRPKK